MTVVLFDLEETLVDTEGPITAKELANQTKRKLMNLGIHGRIFSSTDGSATMRNKATKYVEKYFSDHQRKLFNFELDKFMKDYEVAAAQNSILFGETLQSLRELRNMCATMGIVTNTSKEAADIILSMHSLREFFQVVVTREDVKMLKPSPEGIQLALSRLCWKDKQFFFVGDSLFDITATVEAKGIPILVCRKCSRNWAQLANYTVQSLLEVPKVIMKFT